MESGTAQSSLNIGPLRFKRPTRLESPHALARRATLLRLSQSCTWPKITKLLYHEPVELRFFQLHHTLAGDRITFDLRQVIDYHESMSNPAELALAIKAIQSGLGGCVEWDINAEAKVRYAMAGFGLTPEGIRDELIQFVQAGGQVDQKKESRPNWLDNREYWYRVIVPMPAIFAKGLFVELELRNSDPDYPEVNLVNAHEQH